ncbi:MAG: Maf family protein [Succinivibrio sp.]
MATTDRDAGPCLQGWSRRLILASGSPRRREMLGLVCGDFDVIASNAGEARLEGEAPDAMAGRLAIEKASDVSSGNHEAIVLGFDTVVALGNEVFGKPGTMERALGHLRALNGRTHLVHTGYAICIGGKCQADLCGVVTTEVEFGKFPDAVLEGYAATLEGLDKAGGYAIQGRGAFLVRSIRGSYTSVVGLPLCETAQALERLGAGVLWK